ncbi:inorganic phosphate transporter [Agromyces sp. ISL-38]|uniref:inorganic phosphate transporter n=1 Tax=Agromyces sp. ISL-38 TaxID=2819107 RepID=UPI001BE8CDD5|nr:inorganic phosphate transporter [Agromyces sp. ISL-38]MBT2497738.1 inorganic phosphate transporter [Agromyces sp. ISL-38]
MEYLTGGLALVFAVLVGRNDGAPLVALALRPLHRRSSWPPAVLIAATVVVPAVGVQAVGGTLADLFRSSAGSSGLGLAVLLLATISTLLISTVTGIPTSITLALVGASAGAQVAHGVLEGERIARVLVLAAAGPVVAWLLALAVTRLLMLARGPSLERTVRWQQITGFVATAVAYGANDGQKLLAVFAVMFGINVAGGAVDPRVIGLVVACFAIGTMLGLRRSANGLRQGVLHPKPYQVASTLWSSATAVLVGSALAAPMSMTQSVTGALIGSAPPREWRRVRWEQSRRVVLAWLWTLPVAAVAGWALTLATGLLAN